MSGPVFLIENHDQACHIWREAGCKERILVHVDAHHDMWWIKEKGFITIANFICRALRDGQVRKTYWVTPDPAWKSASGRRPILVQLKKLLKQYPGPAEPVHIDGERLSASVFGRPFQVCSLAALPQIDEAVLLDIDVDFLMIPRPSVGVDEHGELPWCWPADLLARLAAAHIQPDLTTIAYSVEGGYTPLKWKYLGDELALRLQGGQCSHAALRGMDRLRQGSEADRRSDFAGAEMLYQEAAALLPNHAAPCFRLAHLLGRQGRLEEARKLYQQALQLDPSYHTPYNSGGLWNFRARRFGLSEKEHRRTLDLNPQDAYAHYGIGRLSARRKRWREAEEWYAKAATLDTKMVDAYRELGNVSYALGKRQNAIQAYTRALRLVLEGHRPLGSPIATNPEQNLDPARWYIHARLARLYDLEGDRTQAINGYRMAIAGGYDGFLVRLHLARLYLLRQEWREGGRHLAEALSKIPSEVWWAGRRTAYRLTFGVKG